MNTLNYQETYCCYNTGDNENDWKDDVTAITARHICFCHNCDGCVENINLSDSDNHIQRRVPNGFPVLIFGDDTS